MADNFEKISASDLQMLLLDPEVPDSALRPYLMVDHSASGAYRPEVRVNPSRVEGPGTAQGDGLTFDSLSREEPGPFRLRQPVGRGTGRSAFPA
jgi:hypothetical protein